MAHSDYIAVAAELKAGTPPELICATCPWTRMCVHIPSMTSDEVDQKLSEAEALDLQKDPARQGLPSTVIATALATAGRDSSGAQCPVFTVRLRSSRTLSDQVRTLMQGWPSDDGGTERD